MGISYMLCVLCGASFDEYCDNYSCESCDNIFCGVCGEDFVKNNEEIDECFCAVKITNDHKKNITDELLLNYVLGILSLDKNKIMKQYIYQKYGMEKSDADKIELKTQKVSNPTKSPIKTTALKLTTKDTKPKLPTKATKSKSPTKATKPKLLTKDTKPKLLTKDTKQKLTTKGTKLKLPIEPEN